MIQILFHPLFRVLQILSRDGSSSDSFRTVSYSYWSL